MKDKNFNHYIVFWLTGSLSQLGSSMTGFSLIIWAYKQTNSAISVSLMTFFSYLPYIAVSIFAGALIDKHRKKSIMLTADLIAASCSMVVLALVVMNRLEIWHIYIVNGVIGLMNSIESPAQTVAVGMMVPKEKYAQVSGMNSFSNSLLTVITPMLAAFIYSFSGLKGIIFIDLITFLIAFVTLMLIIPLPECLQIPTDRNNNILHDCKAGLLFLINHKGIWYIVISMAFLNFFSRLTYENILTPMILGRSGGDEKVLGIVNGILGAGGIIGGLIVSFKKIHRDNIKLIYYSAALSFLFGDLLMGLGQNTIVWCIAAFAASAPISFINAGQSLIMYHAIPKELQGRVFAVRNAIQYCTIPMGILLGGFLADCVFEPYMLSDHKLALFLQKFVGFGQGSGMAVMFLISGVSGFISSIFWYHNKEIRKLQK
ncbi:MFS transporter [Anaerocolumna sedimenticola]|uniref:MFS transporter n=1 Tax=Anaerocolumna sedimenticola TaxID=2696063 RepID=A0A6P1TK53_9FIRM|nr:MFS transporter [Anaerocolumna sedimenticola]QHQ60441.1 MFS transporter [Anaerocolumna sedimenticola]